ncbi:beta-mannanase [Paenibacillus sp. P96]|uniref:Beta-mannanase n=1 Tax=Paenibacillus zeirhizosphaerae TaxID=2987519 RepID=A0ABT9FRE2_9BACL|nr:beta-mannanase [Paenibacillus sp. P96]MDP4097292.1 beta-mannanase [Paenibacillus sp. P96]
MQYREAQPGMPIISELSCRLDDHHVVLRWRWPEGVQAVYIAKQEAEPADGSPPSAISGELKLFTREEYKALGSYQDRIEGIGRLRYTVYASIMEEGQMMLVRQSDGANSAEISTGKAKIRYTVDHKKGLFSRRKTVRITVTAEIPIPKEALCYVKKEGGYPLDKEDGTVYPFTRPFAAGRNALPPIEVGASEYVRLFFTDGRKYGSTFELIPE